MSSAIYGAFFFTVLLLVITGYFLLGGLPLLVLEHDIPLDARFICSFFAVYYKGAFWTALGAAASYVLWGRIGLAIGATAVALLATLLRRRFLPVMERVGAQIEAHDAGVIRRFRRMHGMALLFNLGLLVVLVAGTVQLSRSL